MTGQNQHVSRKRAIVSALVGSRFALADAAYLRRIGAPGADAALAKARGMLAYAQSLIHAAPPSTRRRWRAGY